MRWIVRVAAGLLLALIVVLVGVLFYFDQVIGTVIERGGVYALGVPTSVDSVSLRPISGSLRIGGLTIANPPGFSEKNFLRLGDGFLEIDVATLRQPTVEIRSVRVTDVELALQKSAKGTNYDVILGNMSEADSEAESAADESEGEGTQLVIDDLVIENIRARYDVVGGLAPIEVTVPEVRITNIGGEGDPVTTAELAQIIVHALLASVARLGGDLPADLTKGLNSGLSRLGKAGFDWTAKAGTAASDAGAAVGRSAGESAGKAVEALGGLLGKKKEE